MRYAEATYGEYATALGQFTTGSTVNIAVYSLPSGTLIPLTASGCVEIGSTGVFTWDSSSIQTQPSGYQQMLYIMTASGTLRNHMGKLIVGGFPSDSAKRRFGSFIHINTTAGTSGTTWPAGTLESPVNNVDDARTIADRENIHAFSIDGAITISGDYSNWSFEGVEPSNDIINFAAGSVASGSQFFQTGVRGILNGSITCQECLIGDGGVTSGLQGIFNTCGFLGTIKVGGQLQGLDLASQSLIPGVTIDMAHANANLVLLGQSTGIWLIDNLGPGKLLGASLAGAALTLKSTCAGGFAFLYGYGEVNDNSTGTSVSDFVLKGSELAAVDPDLTTLQSSVNAVAADVERLYGRNQRTRLWYADAAIVSGQGGAVRNVPSGVASHMETQVKTDAQADWSSPTTFYVTFNYAADATATTPPASAEPETSAPTDGTFSAEPYPA